MNRIRLLLAASLVAITPVFGVEHATYNSAGALTSLIAGGAALPVRAELVVSFEGGVRQTLQPHDQRSPVTREGEELKWHGVSTFPNGTQAQFSAAWTESDAGVAFTGSATAGAPRLPGAPAPHWPLHVKSVEYVIDVPRDAFIGGHVEPGAVPLPNARPQDPAFLHTTTAKLTFADAAKNWTLAIAFDQPRDVTVTDRWDAQGRSYRVHVKLGGGTWMTGDAIPFAATFQLSGTAHAATAQLTVAPETKRYPFDGFGGDFCFETQTPVIEYMLDNLHCAWARLELKAVEWDAQRTQPGPELRRDFELMQRIQKSGIPWIISLWRLPERYYADPNQKPFGSFNRQIAADRWPEFLDLIGSYLVYLKQHYGAEPDFYSFNEPDLGVDVGFTAETHRDMIKRIGAHFASLGLKTKLLLGDTANPRDTHKYVLPTASDPEAMKYVGAVSFHSWGNGTPQQYAAWGDVGTWIGLPLVVAEAGTDPGSYRNHNYDSYAYGLGEMQQYHELLRDSRPQALIYWEFTEDYGLVHLKSDHTIEPTGRFWMMKQWVNLTPQKSKVVATTSDQPDVFVTAFVRDDGATAVHVLNTGAERDATLKGLPAGKWRAVLTTETKGFDEAAALPGADGHVHLPARSFLTLVKP